MFDVHMAVLFFLYTILSQLLAPLFLMIALYIIYLAYSSWSFYTTVFYVGVCICVLECSLILLV